MHKVIYLYMAMLMLAANGQSASNHCSLKVIAQASDGREPETLVRVKTALGRVVEKENELGGVYFCELGLKPVSVTVGEGCNVVTVDTVELIWGQTRILRVIHDPCRRHDHVPQPTPGCSVLLYVRGPDDDLLADAVIDIRSVSNYSERADRFGRALLALPFNSTTRGTVSKPGHEAATFSFECSSGRETEEIEVRLRLAQ